MRLRPYITAINPEGDKNEPRGFLLSNRQPGAIAENGGGKSPRGEALLEVFVCLAQVPVELNRLGIHKRLWICDCTTLDVGGCDAESVFAGFARAGDQSGRSGADAACRGGTVQGERQFGDPLGATLAGQRRDRGQAAQDHEAVLLSVAAEQPDLTLDEFCSVLRQREIATSRVSLCRFFGRHGFSFKKNRACQRAGARRRGRAARALAAGSAQP